MEKTTCFWRHDWSKWVVVSRRTLQKLYRYGQWGECGTSIRQERTCARCGKVQFDRTILTV